MKYVIIINGSGGSGKDEFVSMMSNYLRVTNISSMDKIKEAATILGWCGSKDEDSRKFLSDLKRLSIQYNDFPFEYIKKCIANFYFQNDTDIMFLHIREPKEIKKIKHFYQTSVLDIEVRTVLVENPRIEPITSNLSDKNVNKYKYDYILKNEGSLNDLDKKAKGFAEYLFEN